MPNLVSCKYLCDEDICFNLCLNVPIDSYRVGYICEYKEDNFETPVKFLEVKSGILFGISLTPRAVKTLRRADQGLTEKTGTYILGLV